MLQLRPPLLSPLMESTEQARARGKHEGSGGRACHGGPARTVVVIVEKAHDEDAQARVRQRDDVPARGPEGSAVVACFEQVGRLAGARSTRERVGGKCARDHLPNVPRRAGAYKQSGSRERLGGLALNS